MQIFSRKDEETCRFDQEKVEIQIEVFKEIEIEKEVYKEVYKEL